MLKERKRHKCSMMCCWESIITCVRQMDSLAWILVLWVLITTIEFVIFFLIVNSIVAINSCLDHGNVV